VDPDVEEPHGDEYARGDARPHFNPGQPDAGSGAHSDAGFGGDAPTRSWWRPTGTFGRIFLLLCTVVVLGAAGMGALLLKTYVERDARFRISGAGNIQTSGLAQVTRAELLPVFGEDIGRNIFFVNLEERRRELEEIPWVEHATVMRLLPDRIRVTVVERKPVAFTRIDNEVGLIDADGVVLSMSPTAMAQFHYSFPVVTGIDPHAPPAARKARMEVYMRLMAELDANNQHFSEQISEIDLSNPEDARVLMPEQGADVVAHFGSDHFLERYQRFQAHIAEWRQQYPKLASVDLTYDQQAVLQMAQGGEAIQPNGDGTAAAGSVPGQIASSTKDSDEIAPPAAKPLAGTHSAASTNKSSLKADTKTNTKSAAAKAKTERDNKKHAEQKHAAQSPGKPQPAFTVSPAPASASGGAE
jgi:cell division protein FtsQ